MKTSKPDRSTPRPAGRKKGTTTSPGSPVAFMDPKRLPAPAPKGPTFDGVIRARLTFLADQPPTARTLRQIERTAKLGTELLALTSDDTALDMRGRRMESSLSGSPDEGYSPYGMGMANPGVMAPSPAAETFGSNIMRELITGITALTTAKKPPSAVSLVEAIASARRAGLKDVEADLRAQLRALSPSTPADPATKPQKTPAKARKGRRLPTTPATP